MAVVTLKAGAATARDASPQQPVDPKLTRGCLLESIGYVECNSDDSIGSVYIMCHGIPSNARISEVVIDSDDIGTAGEADIGLYDQTGTVVDADFFASAKVLDSGALAKTDVTHESGVYPITNLEKELWDALSLSADPQTYYDVCLTLTEAVNAAGSIVLRVRYVVGMG